MALALFAASAFYFIYSWSFYRFSYFGCEKVKKGVQ
jgi:hypothetical protein